MLKETPKPCLKEKQQALLEDLMQNELASDRHLEWGGLIALENKNWTIAEEIFAGLLERRKQPEDLTGLASALTYQGRYQEAEECLLESLNQIPSPCPLLFTVYKNLGQVYFLSKSFDLAEEYFNKAYTLKPQSHSLKFNQAYLHLKLKNYQEAEESFMSLVKSNEQSVAGWLGLALARHHLKDFELSEACLEKSLDLNPNYEKALKLKSLWKEIPEKLSHFSFSF